MKLSIDDDNYVILDMSLGGRIKQLKLLNHTVISSQQPYNSLASGCYLMFPWVNRVEHNPYSNNKYAHFDDNGLPLHGLSVNSPRIHVITMQDNLHCQVKLRQAEQDPQKHHFQQVLTLSRGKVNINFQVIENPQDKHSYCFGYHPYLQIDNESLHDIQIHTDIINELKLDEVHANIFSNYCPYILSRFHILPSIHNANMIVFLWEGLIYNLNLPQHLYVLQVICHIGKFTLLQMAKELQYSRCHSVAIYTSYTNTSKIQLNLGQSKSPQTPKTTIDHHHHISIQLLISSILPADRLQHYPNILNIIIQMKQTRQDRQFLINIVSYVLVAIFIFLTEHYGIKIKSQWMFEHSQSDAFDTQVTQIYQLGFYISIIVIFMSTLSFIIQKIHKINNPNHWSRNILNEQSLTELVFQQLQSFAIFIGFYYYLLTHDAFLTNHWQRDLIPFWYVVSCVAKVLSRLAVVIGPQGYNWDIFGVTLFYATNALMICLIFDYSPLA